MKICRVVLAVLAMVLLAASPALAQPAANPVSTGITSTTLFAPTFGPAFGAGLVILGAAMGFGKIGAAALEGMARQPEVAGRIQPAMVIIAALLEGATFFALLVCLIGLFR